MKSKSTQEIFEKVKKTNAELPELTRQFHNVSKLASQRKPGRPPLHDKAMVKLNCRVPPEVKAAMIAKYGGVQAAVDALVIEPLLKRKTANTHGFCNICKNEAPLTDSICAQCFLDELHEVKE